MNQRQLKKAFRQLQATASGRDQLRMLVQGADECAYAIWTETPNGSAELQAQYQAMDDMDDSLAGIQSAVEDGHQVEALRLIDLARDSIEEHITALKELF